MMLLTKIEINTCNKIGLVCWVKCMLNGKYLLVCLENCHISEFAYDIFIGCAFFSLSISI